MSNVERIISVLVLSVLGICLTACDKDKPFFLVSIPEFAVVDGPGTYTLTSECGEQRQLLGGGYYFPEGNSSLQLAVTASYPSGRNSWTVVFENPDNEFAETINGSIIAATAYCLSAQDYPLDTTIVEETSTPAPSSGPTAILAKCPRGSVLTGGGFRTGVSGPNFGYHNANLFVSAPTMDDDGIGDGWQVAVSYLPQDTVPSTTVSAMCAQQNLTAGPVVVEPLDLTDQPFGWGWSSITAACPPSMFTTAGGYSIIGDFLIARQVTTSVTADHYGSWRISAAFGYQTPNYDFRPCDPNVSPACAITSSIAACIEMPDIPLVSIEILEPVDGATFGAVGPDSASTAPITFTAEAFDEQKNPLTGAAIQWTADGMPIGSGTTVNTALPTTPGLARSVLVKAVAVGQSTAASDIITVSVGTVD